MEFVPLSSNSTQAASIAVSIAYLAKPTTKKAHHRHHRRWKKKPKKQKCMLTEVSVPHLIKNNVLTDHDIENEIIVLDGGNSKNPPIQPPDGVHWQCISVLESKFIMTIDETDPQCGLPMSPLHVTCPFIHMPRAQ